MSSRVRGIVAIIYLVLCLLLGGASAIGAGAVGNAILQTLAVIIILALMWTRRATIPAEARWLIAAFGLFLGWGLLSLVPLPAALWQALPYRGEIAEGLEMLGIDGQGMPASLAPSATIASLLWLLPPAALFLIAVTLAPDARRRLFAAVIFVAALSICLGIFQLLGGTGSNLRFYEITNQGSPVGFFSNINHQATLLLCALPCVAVIGARFATRRDRSKRSGGMVMTTALALFLTGGIALSGSVAGYGLFLIAAFASLLIYRRATAGTIGTTWKAALAVLLVAFVTFAATGPLNREALAEKYSDSESSRGELAGTTIEAIADSFPAGTGLGSFANVFRRYQDPLQVQREYANHAHNDYLEIVLEQGVAGLLVVGLFFFWWGRRTIWAWRIDGAGASAARAGSVIIGIVLLHSIVDYPMRTSAIAAIVALACAALMPPPVPRKRRSEGDAEPAARHLEAV